jgi:fagellar hook-basal body proteins
MVRGLYTAYTGMVNEQNRLDIISNNLANSATVGYKTEGVTNQAFKDVLTLKIQDDSEAYMDKAIGTMNTGVKLGEVYTDYGQGPLRSTGNTYDMAIGGNGFFNVSVKDKNGNESIKYTRDGNFKISNEGYIVDSDGNLLQGESGSIQIPTNAGDVKIDKDGTITADNVVIDKVKLTDFADYNYLKKYGDNMYEAVANAETKNADGSIEQGYTEQSNVNTVAQMVQMITISRSYEANQKVIQTVDNMLGQAVGSVGKV